jgi:hypothetical protein
MFDEFNKNGANGQNDHRPVIYNITNIDNSVTNNNYYGPVETVQNAAHIAPQALPQPERSKETKGTLSLMRDALAAALPDWIKSGLRLAWGFIVAYVTGKWAFIIALFKG